MNEYIESNNKKQKDTNLAALEKVRQENIASYETAQATSNTAFQDAMTEMFRDSQRRQADTNAVLRANALNEGVGSQAALSQSNAAMGNEYRVKLAKKTADREIELAKKNNEEKAKAAVQQAIANQDYNTANQLYAEYQDERKTAQEQVDRLISAGIMPDAELIGKSGYTSDYVSAKYAKSTYRGSGRGSGSGSKLTAEQVRAIADAATSKLKAATDKISGKSAKRFTELPSVTNMKNDAAARAKAEAAKQGAAKQTAQQQASKVANQIVNNGLLTQKLNTLTDAKSRTQYVDAMYSMGAIDKPTYLNMSMVATMMPFGKQPTLTTAQLAKLPKDEPLDTATAQKIVQRISGGTPLKLPATAREATEMVYDYAVKEWRKEYDKALEQYAENAQYQGGTDKPVDVVWNALDDIKSAMDKDNALVLTYDHGKSNREEYYAYWGRLDARLKALSKQFDYGYVSPEDGYSNQGEFAREKSVRENAEKLEEYFNSHFEDEIPSGWERAGDAAKSVWQETLGVLNMLWGGVKGAFLTGDSSSMTYNAESAEAAKQAVSDANAKASELFLMSEESLAEAKKYASSTASFLVDLEKVALEVLEDAAVSAVTNGYGGLANMALRTTGSTYFTSVANGMDEGDAALLALERSAMGVLTERLGGLKFYGGGKLLSKIESKILPDAMAKLEKNYLFRTVVKGGMEESLEELIENVGNNYADVLMGFRDDASMTDEEASELLYEMLIASIIGFAGANVELGVDKVKDSKNKPDPAMIADTATDVAIGNMAQNGKLSEQTAEVLQENVEQRAEQRLDAAIDNTVRMTAQNAAQADVEATQQTTLPDAENSTGKVKLDEYGEQAQIGKSVGAAERGFSEKDTAVSQFATNTMRRTMSEEQYNDPDLISSVMQEQEIKHNADTKAAAQKTFNVLKTDGGYDAVMDYLFERAGDNFGVEDLQLAELMRQEVQTKLENEDYKYDLSALERGENPNAEYDALTYYENELNYMLMKQARGAGQILQTIGAWTSRATPRSALDEIREEIDSNQDMSEAEKAAKYKEATDWINKIKQIKPTGKNANGALKIVIKDIADKRGVTRLMWWNKKRAPIASKILDWSLDRLTFPELQQLALSSAQASVYDATTVANIGQRLKTAQVLYLLSKPKTVGKNLLGNTVMTAVDAISMDGAALADMMLANATGTRSVAADKWIFSKDARHGMQAATVKSLAEVLLDVDMGGEGRYGGSVRTNKMAGNAVERTFSTWERNNAVAMVTTDEAFKGAVRGGTEAALRKLQAEGKIKAGEEYAKEQADKLAKERTFQQKSALVDAVKSIHDFLNIAGIGRTGNKYKETNAETKAFGAGDILAPFTKVTGNMLVTAANYSPANAIKGFSEMLRVANEAQNGKEVNPEQQAQAVKDFSRGVNGTVLMAICIIVARAGLLRRADDEGDKDVAALNAAEGMTGTQLNFDAMTRYFNGEGSEWKKGDSLFDISALEPLNLIMAIGTVVAGWDENTSFMDVIDVYGDAIEELPILQFISDVYEDMRYGDEGFGASALKEFASTAANQATPNIIKGFASGTDQYYRDTYSGKTFLDHLIDMFKSGNSLTRDELPIKQTPFGENKEYSGTATQNFFNQMFNPVGINTYEQGKLSAEMQRIRNATDRVDFYPDKTAPKSVETGGKEYRLSYEERAEYQTVAGEYYKGKADALLKSAGWNNLDANQQADVLMVIRSASEAEAKREYFAKMRIEYSSGSAKKTDKYISLAKQGGYALREQLYYENATHECSSDVERVKAAFEAAVNERTILDNLGTDEGMGKAYSAYSESGAKSSNVDLLLYSDLYDYRYNRAKGTDKNGDGKTDSGSVKADVRRYIESLGINLTSKQVDALMVSLGYKV